MTDEELRELLRVAIPPIGEDDGPADVWPAVVNRIGAAPRWTMFDLGLAVAAAIALLMFPEWLWLLVYHL